MLMVTACLISCVIVYTLSVCNSMLLSVFWGLVIFMSVPMSGSFIVNLVIAIALAGIIVALINGFQLIHRSCDYFLSTLLPCVAIQLIFKLAHKTPSVLETCGIILMLIILPRVFWLKKQTQTVFEETDRKEKFHILGGYTETTIYGHYEEYDFTKTLLNFGMKWPMLQLTVSVYIFWKVAGLYKDMFVDFELLPLHGANGAKAVILILGLVSNLGIEFIRMKMNDDDLFKGKGWRSAELEGQSENAAAK